MEPDQPELPATGENGFAEGADISWVTEMESKGHKFYNAKGEERDVVAGLDAGANDYVTKPFSKAILLARIRAFLRTAGQEAGPLALDGLVFDEAAHAVALNGAPLDLTLSEYRILELLVRNVHRVFTRAHIIDRISDGQKCVTDRTVDVLLVGLRRKLGAWADHVKTIRGVGYRAE